MVQLKLAVSDLKPNTASIFQFHNGTIKTKVGDNVAVRVTKFQFHNGTIKT